ncbi:hypothetical protein ROLI_029440 [Roseobacter fucihabitans]|uniref:Transposase n=1 Tax=Roseobacter fucihabitans TaxID=1537242 RepID=A0ABZ2BUZ7_9RHOB|nr:Transposase [Roseobacter litoralis]
MGLKRTDEFRQDAMRIALTSGLTRKQVAGDLGVGMSTLNKWITAHRDTDVVSKEDLSLAQENDRLRRENRLLKEKREILKKATQWRSEGPQEPRRGQRSTGLLWPRRPVRCPGEPERRGDAASGCRHPSGWAAARGTPR